jgi:hypothetical protein
LGRGERAARPEGVPARVRGRVGDRDSAGGAGCQVLFGRSFGLGWVFGETGGEEGWMIIAIKLFCIEIRFHLTFRGGVDCVKK